MDEGSGGPGRHSPFSGMNHDLQLNILQHCLKHPDGNAFTCFSMASHAFQDQAQLYLQQQHLLLEQQLVQKEEEEKQRLKKEQQQQQEGAQEQGEEEQDQQDEEDQEQQQQDGGQEGLYDDEYEDGEERPQQEEQQELQLQRVSRVALGTHGRVELQTVFKSWPSLTSLSLMLPEQGRVCGQNPNHEGYVMCNFTESAQTAAAEAAKSKKHLPLRALSLSSSVHSKGQLARLSQMFSLLQRLEVCFAKGFTEADREEFSKIQLADFRHLSSFRQLTSLVLRTKLNDDGAIQQLLPPTLINLAWEGDGVLAGAAHLSHLSLLRSLSLRQSEGDMAVAGVAQLTWVDSLALSGINLTPPWLTRPNLLFLGRRLVDLGFVRVTGAGVGVLTKLSWLSALTALRMPVAFKNAAAEDVPALADTLKLLPALKCLEVCASSRMEPLVKAMSACGALQQVRLTDADAVPLYSGHLSNIRHLTKLQLAAADLPDPNAKPNWSLILIPLTRVVYLEVSPKLLVTGHQVTGHPAANQAPKYSWLRGLACLQTLSLTNYKQLAPPSLTPQQLRTWVPLDPENPLEPSPLLAEVVLALQQLTQPSLCGCCCGSTTMKAWWWPCVVPCRSR